MPRRLAIADIHGCALTFEALLDSLQLSSSDELYLLGDYIDRGPRSKQVIELIMRLQREDYSIFPLRGNHDQYLLDAVLLKDKPSKRIWKEAGAKSTRSSYISPENPKGKILPTHTLWLNSLPYYFLLDDYVLVHAGLNFRRSNPMKGRKAMLHARHWYENIDYDWLGKREVIHGHTPLPRYLIEQQVIPDRRLYPVFNIDAGCSHLNRPYHGYLCCMDLDARTFVFEPNREAFP